LCETEGGTKDNERKLWEMREPEVESKPATPLVCPYDECEEPVAGSSSL
jgi:hypothetical protein